MLAGYNQEIKPLLEVISQIQMMMTEEDEITLPQIAFIGDQSSGKTSVLESIIMEELPKGEGTKTKCPNVFELRST